MTDATTAIVPTDSADVPAPRRPWLGLRRPADDKRQQRDQRPMYAALGALLVEVAPGVYVEAGRRPVLWSAENADGFTILTIAVDKR